MTILITGGAGFVGSNLSVFLKKKYPHYSIIALDNLSRRGSELNFIRLQEHQVEFIHADIRNKEDLHIDKDIHCIIDASADPSVLAGIQSPVYPLINTNLMGTVHALELATKHNALFLFLSTSRVYPIQKLENLVFEEQKTRFQWLDNQPSLGISSQGIEEHFSLEGARSFYGATKLASELLIQEYHANKNLNAIINRCGVIAGPWQMGKIDQGVLVFWLASHYFKKELNYIGYGGLGKQMRDILHIEDLFDLIDLQIHHPKKCNGKIFNVGGGLKNSLSLQELTKFCQEITGNKIPIHSVKENRKADIRIYVTNNKNITQTTAWEPKKTSYQLVQDTFTWLQDNEHVLKKILIL